MSLVKYPETRIAEYFNVNGGLKVFREASGGRAEPPPRNPGRASISRVRFTKICAASLLSFPPINLSR